VTEPVVGVDPGGTYTGVIARHGPRLLYGATVTRDGTVPDYLVEVCATIDRAVDAVHRELNTASPGVAVEDLNEPTPHLGLTNLKGLIGAAQVLGAVLCTHPDAVIVAPGGHGSAPLATYPPALVGDREVVGTGKARHMRSAFDVAGAAYR
jgi:hypothetical protein